MRPRTQELAPKMIPTSALVLAAVVVLPLASLLVDLALLEVARSRQRITALARTLADEPITSTGGG
jgi:hypothetical protein